MNRKMRRMLAKNSGNIDGLLNNPQVSQALNNTSASDLMKVMKDPQAKKMFKALKKHKKDEGIYVCPECGEETHFKGAICKCEHCGKYIFVKDICNELEDDEHLQEILEVMNGTENETFVNENTTNEDA